MIKRINLPLTYPVNTGQSQIEVKSHDFKKIFSSIHILDVLTLVNSEREVVLSS